jgi:hypothetical protein
MKNTLFVYMIETYFAVYLFAESHDIQSYDNEHEASWTGDQAWTVQGGPLKAFAKMHTILH